MDEEKNYATFSVGDESYIIKFNQKRIDLYEASNRSILASLYDDKGMLKQVELKSLLAYGLCVEGGAWVNPKQGMAMAGELVMKNGSPAMLEAVIEALQRDCAFLFQGA